DDDFSRRPRGLRSGQRRDYRTRARGSRRQIPGTNQTRRRKRTANARTCAIQRIGTRIVTMYQNEPMPRRAMSYRTPPISAFMRSAKPTIFVSHTSAIANPSRARSASSVKTANASTGASVSERPAEPTCASNPEPVVYKIERNPAPTGTDAHSRRNACGAKHRAAPRGTDVAVNLAVRPSVVCLSGAEPNLRRPLGFGRGDAVRPQGIEERFRAKCPKDHSAAVR